MDQKVVVVTGASSGIGRLTSLRLAQEGINIVLASRNSAALKEVAADCRKYDAKTLVQVTDVVQEDDVLKLAHAAIEKFGRIDVWINSAAVTSVGRFTETPPDVFRRVIETNLFGTVYGSRVALEQFTKQRSGTLINISSVFGVIPSPYESPYVASKFAVRGFSASLREELLLADMQSIHVCTILPAAIDTPIYRNAANLIGKGLQPPRPIYPTRRVVNAIVRVIDAPQPEVFVGNSGRLMAALHAALPQNAFEKLFGGYIENNHFTQDDAPVTQGNLFEPSPIVETSGHWPKRPPQKPLYVAGMVVLLGGLWLLSRKRQPGDKNRG